jgi:tRNA(Ile)-lysidine synthase
MKQTLTKFLYRHYNQEKPVLLGLSGGPDSLALLHLLLEFKEKHPLNLGIAHVDHCWREESTEEARQLEKMAADNGICFHLKTLNPGSLKGNLEAACRQERLQFFASLCHEYGYQAVMLGHHAGDQVETVLKRVLEGASLSCLGGLREAAAFEGLTIWRPLLQFRKTDILNLIEQTGRKPFHDRTNEDPRFLRGRFRTRILPLLSNEFGKQVENSLQRLGSEANELKDYLELKLSPYIHKIQQGPWGFFLDLSTDCPEHLFETKFLIKKICQMTNCLISRNCLEKAAKFIESKEADKYLTMGNRILYIDRRRLFLLMRPIPALSGICRIESGAHEYRGWKVVASMADAEEKTPITSWKDAWEGKCEVCLPQGNYHLGMVSLSANFPFGSPIGKWWTNGKVPAFLRYGVPVVWEDCNIRAEFLTGHTLAKKSNVSDKWMKISLEYAAS